MMIVMMTYEVPEGRLYSSKLFGLRTPSISSLRSSIFEDRSHAVAESFFDH